MNRRRPIVLHRSTTRHTRFAPQKSSCAAPRAAQRGFHGPTGSVPVSLLKTPQNEKTRKPRFLRCSTLSEI